MNGDRRIVTYNCCGHAFEIGHFSRQRADCSMCKIAPDSDPGAAPGRGVLIFTVIVLLILSCNTNSQNPRTMDDTVKLQVNVSGEGTPILLIPGGLTGWKSWEPFVELFSAKHREVINVQLLNVQYGLEDRALPDGYSVETESRALASTLDSLGYPEPLDIVAWSYGGFAALDYALDHPERIRTLTLIEPAAKWVLQAQGSVDDEVQRMIDFHDTFRGDISEDMLASFLRDAGLVPDGQSPRELPQWKEWVPFRQSLRILPSIYTHEDDLGRLQNFDPPVLLVKGTGSSQIEHHIIDGLAANLPRARVIELPGGHAAHIVSMDRFLSELDNFQKESTGRCARWHQ